MDHFPALLVLFLSPLLLALKSSAASASAPEPKVSFRHPHPGLWVPVVRLPIVNRGLGSDCLRESMVWLL